MTVDIAAAQRKLQELAGRHQTELRSGIEAANTEADAAYQRASRKVSESALRQLGVDIADIVQDARERADDLAVSHVLNELRTAVGSGANGISITLPGRPLQRDVAQYVDNCVTWAREAVDGAKDGEQSAALLATQDRAHVVIESEADSRYEAARSACLKSLQRMTDEQAQRLGFAIARSQDQFRAVEQLELRGDTEWIPIIGRRWDSRADACPKCNAAHGELRPLGFSFSLPGPGAHARCKCTSSLWILPFPHERSLAGLDHAMKNKNDPPTDPKGFAVLHRTLDLRAATVDPATRTIVGAVASDESEDSHGSVIKAKGWDLTRYANNPLLLWNHPVGGWGERAEPEDVLGTTTAYVKGKTLLADLHFLDKETNEQADQVFKMMTCNPPAIRMLSVGFRPTEYHYEKRSEGGEDLLVIDSAELYEISVLPIGSNQNALACSLREICMKHDPTVPAPPPPVVERTVEATTPATPNGDTVMTDKNEDKGVAIAVNALPAEIAARLAVDSIDKAISEIDKRDLTIDKLTKDLAAAVESRDSFKTQIEKREAEDAAAEVDALIGANRIDGAKRDMALRSYKADRDAFRALYPATAPAPSANLLVPPPIAAEVVEPTSPMSDVNPINARAEALIKTGVDYTVAWSRALNEYKLGTLPAPVAA
ncbi:MAG: hypothetical protein WC563_15665 [Brevundimonas sp.]